MYAIDITGQANGSIGYDIRHPNGNFAGLVVRKANGTFRHYFNGNATRGGTRKLQSWDEVFDSIDKRMSRLKAKQAA